MRKWLVNLLCALAILVLLAGVGYGLAWMATVPNPLQTLLPSLGLSSLGLGLGGGGGGAGARTEGGGGAGAPPPPAARRSGPGDGGGGGASTPSAPSGSGPHSASPPPPKQSNAEKSPPKDGNAATGDTAAAPPPLRDCRSVEEKLTRRVMLLLGCAISILSFSNPLVIHWSLGSSLPETLTFHSLWDLIATAASCLAWLLFGITQLHVEGNRILGVEAVVVNLMGVIVYTLCTVIKMAGAANVHIKGCIGAVIALCGPTFIVLYFTVFGPIERDSLAATWISFGATFVQVLSQFLPFRSLFQLCYPPADAPAQHANAKKLIIYSRSCNLTVSVYWAMYCVFTYEHDYFEVANVISAVVALVTFVLHLIYALEPQPAV